MRSIALIAAVSLATVSCGANGTASRDVALPTDVTTSTSTVSVTAPEATTATSTEQPGTVRRTVTVDGAVAMNVATNGTSDPVVAWTDHEAVTVAHLDPTTLELGDATAVSGSVTPLAHPIERPALSIGDDEVLRVAFTSAVGTAGTVQYVEVDGADRPEPVRISGEPRPETNLPHMTAADDAPALAWLEDSTLSVATNRDGVPVEIEGVDDLTCDCCNPVPIRWDDGLVVAYRDLERSPDGIIRDIYTVSTASIADAERGFGEPVLVSDDHWFLDGCPFSGPAVVDVGDDLVVAWMDARQSLHPEQRDTTIWVDRSSDGGASFGADTAVTDGGIHRWPSIAVDDDGVVHLIWETQGDDGGISYTASVDGGRSFAPPVVLLANTDASGAHRAPTVIVHRDQLLVTWVDRLGGHLAGFALGELGR